MRVMSSEAQCVYTKMVVVALLASVTVAELIPENVLRSSYAVETLNAARVPALVERHLRSSATILASDHTEERDGLSEIATLLKQFLSQTIAKPHEWWLRQKSPSDLFTHLKVGETGSVDQLFENQNFIQWATILLSNHPKDERTAFLRMYSVLSKQYTDNDALVKGLVARLEIDDKSIASKFAKGLLQEQMKRWVDEGKVTAKDVFVRLHLDKGEGDPFERPAFPLLVQFIKKTNPNTASQETFETLSSHYKGDDALLKVLVARLEIDDKSDASKFARSLLHDQTGRWMEEEGITVEKVFTRLHLHEAKGGPFESPAFPMLVDFAFTTHSSYEAAFEAVYLALLNYYKSDDALVKVLAARLEISDATEVARSLLHVQIEKWAKEGKKSAEDVLTSLSLDKANLFESPALSSAVDFFRLSHPESEEAAYKSMYSFLSNYFKADDTLVNVLFARLKINNGDRYVATLVDNLFDVQIKRWVGGGDTAEDIFTRLDLHKAQDELFKGPAFYLFSRFVGASEASKEMQSRKVFETLSRHYDDDSLAKGLVAQIKANPKNGSTLRLLRMRLLKGKLAGESEDDVLKLLELGMPTDKAKSIRDNFVELFQKSESEVLEEYKTLFGDAKVAEMLTTMKDSGEWAQKLQKAQFEGKKSSRVQKAESMLLEGSITDAQVRTKVVEDYAKLLRGKEPVAHVVTPP